MQRSLLGISIASLLLAGCGKTVVITRGPQLTAPTKTSAVDGIPFYVKRAYCQQKASWNEPQYVVQASALADGVPDDDLGVSVTMSRSEYLRNPSLHALERSNGVALDVKSEAGCEQYRHLKNLLPELANGVVATVDDSDLSQGVSKGDLLLAENSAQIVSYVDYQTVYYYNANRPLTGTSQVDVKLAADGTMTEGSSQVNDQTLSSVTGVFSSLLSGAGAAALPLMMASAPNPKLPEECARLAAKSVTFKVASTVHVYQHTHLFKDADAATEPACLAKPLRTAEQCGAGCSVAITELPAPSAAKPDAKPAPKPDTPK
jgi:hypothetical protein